MKKNSICIIVFILVFVLMASSCTNNNSSYLDYYNSSLSGYTYVEPMDSPFYNERYEANYFYESCTDLIEKIKLNGPEDIYNRSPKFFYYTKYSDYESYEAEFYGFETKYLADMVQYNCYEDYRYKAIAGGRRKIVKDFFEQHFYIPKYFGEEVTIEKINTDKNVLLKLDETHTEYLTVEYLASFNYTNGVSGEIEKNKVFIKFIYTPDFDCWSDLYREFTPYTEDGSSRIVDIHGGYTQSVLRSPQTYDEDGKTYEYLVSGCFFNNDDCDGVPVYYIKLDDNTMVEMDFYINRCDSLLPLERIEPMYSQDMLLDFYNNGDIRFAGFSFAKYEFDD